MCCVELHFPPGLPVQVVFRHRKPRISAAVLQILQCCGNSHIPETSVHYCILAWGREGASKHWKRESSKQLNASELKNCGKLFRDGTLLFARVCVAPTNIGSKFLKQPVVSCVHVI